MLVRKFVAGNGQNQSKAEKLTFVRREGCGMDFCVVRCGKSATRRGKLNFLQ